MKCSEYTSFDQLPRSLSVKQVAEVLGIGINGAYELVRSGSIRNRRFKNRYIIPKNALEDYLNA